MVELKLYRIIGCLLVVLRTEAFIKFDSGLATSFGRTSPKSPRQRSSNTGRFIRHILSTTNPAILSSNSDLSGVDSLPCGSTKALNKQLNILCGDGEAQKALELLEKYEEFIYERDAARMPDERSYTIVIQALGACAHPRATEIADDMLQRMVEHSKEYPDCLPTAPAYNAVIFAWSKGNHREQSAQRCDECLQTLWSMFDETKDARYVPYTSSYISTITALSKSRGGRYAAERAEELLEHMESCRDEFPHLTPTTICANAVLNAWSKSGARDAAKRGEDILDRMESLYEQGRKEMQPNTTSFNTVIDALARSGERGSEHRAEDLLERMEELSNRHAELKDTCKPNHVSFNTVLNCWARSRTKGAARRANAILYLMESKFASNITDIHPDSVTYTTVINAWARSREKDSVPRAEEVLARLERAYRNGDVEAKPNAATYNSMINCYAKSKSPDASDRAIKILESMKEMSLETDREDCHPDVITYTSVIDALSKTGTVEGSEMAGSLLEELEIAFFETGDRKMKPNIRTYTSVVNAIGRSRVNPQRAEATINRIDQIYQLGDNDVRPDVVSYNAVLNAYGWSNEKGKAKKCFEIYKRMLKLYNSKRNCDAKPDIITCNSILNACAFDTPGTDTERAEIIDIVVQTLEAFQSSAPSFGRPNSLTYSHVLSAIANHMPMSDQRIDMAKATFWQCCRSGQVSTIGVTTLNRALAWDDFSSVMGSALQSSKNEKLKFDLTLMPEEWTKFAPPSPKHNWQSRPSRKQA